MVNKAKVKVKRRRDVFIYEHLSKFRRWARRMAISRTEISRILRKRRRG